MKAIWNGATIAESEDTVMVEGNHYFPPDSVNPAYLVDSPTHSRCPWKGKASYKTVRVHGEDNPDAAWFYPAPTRLAGKIKDHYAFWRGVQIID